MAFTVGTPYSGSVPSPAYSGTFIPEIWSVKLIEKFYDATVIGALANTNYEGEIKNHGDKVKIRTKPSISIAAYTAEQALAVTRPSSNVIELLIDKGYYWNTVLDDVMEVQSDLNQMSMWADDASEQMKIQIDTEVLAYMATDMVTLDTGTDNTGTAAGRISGTINLGGTTATTGVAVPIVAKGETGSQRSAIDFILDMGQVLDEQNIPETGRWIVIPSWYATKIKKSELRDASLSGDGTSMLRNGRLGMIDRFTLYSSNLLPTSTQTKPQTGTTTATKIFAGHSHGLTFASQLSKVETLRAESTFGTLLRGLQVYGRKVIDYRAIAMGVVYPE
jgi:hypothetical protein